VNNRRKQYRVTARFDELVQIELVGPKVNAKNVILQDLSAGGAGIVLPASTTGMLRMRDRIELRLSSSKLTDGPVTMFARICHLDERLREPRVGLAFESWRDHRALLDSDLRELFNEREAFRVEPGRHPIITEVATLNRRVRLTGQVKDLSVLGFGLEVPMEACNRLQAGTTVMLRFTLPGGDEVTQVPCQVRFVRADKINRRALMGLRILEGHGRHAVSHSARRDITRFVMSRQRELLRMGVRPDEAPMRSARPDLHV
jgi:c-di-GMP-binding flagellar brake protein YcgR